MSRSSESEILDAHPELRWLVILRNRGWTFRPIIKDDELVGLSASRSRQDYTDAIWFDGGTTMAARVVDDGRSSGCVWTTYSASIEDVVHDVLELPAHGEPGAPRLFLADDLPRHSWW